MLSLARVLRFVTKYTLPFPSFLASSKF